MIEKKETNEEKTALSRTENVTSGDKAEIGDKARNSMIFSAIGENVRTHPGLVVLAVLFVTVLMFAGMQRMNTETSMDDFVPESEAVDAEETIDNDFSGEKTIIFVVEARTGNTVNRNVLSPAALREVYRVEERVRNHEEVSPYLLEDGGVMSIADAVTMVLAQQFNKTLETATDAEIAAAAGAALLNSDIARLVSKVTLIDDGKIPSARFALIAVKIDSVHIRNDSDELENIALDIREVMDDVMNEVMDEEMDEENTSTIDIYLAHGMNHEMQKASKDTLTKLLPVSMIIIVVVLYISLRRVSDVLLSLVAVPIIFIWTFGAVGFLGIGFSQFTFTVPILALSLGIDYGIHSLHRYREEQRNGATPDVALERSITHVGAALFLTTVTTVGAFLSNVVSEVPAIRDFGITVAISILSAFVLMGIFLPALRMLVDDLNLKRRKVTGNGKNGTPVGDSQSRKKIKPQRHRGTERDMESHTSGAVKKGMTETRSRKPYFVMTADAALKYPAAVLAVVVLLTMVSIFGALRLETEMEPTDIVKDDSDFATAFDILGEEFPAAGNENGFILITGDVARVSTIQAMKETIANMDDDDHVVRVDGTAMTDSIVPYLSALLNNESLRSALGVHDSDGNGIPDTDAELEIAYDHLYANGLDTENMTATPGDIRSVLHRDENSENSDGDENGNENGEDDVNVKYDMTLIKVEARDVKGFDGKHLLDELEDDAGPLDKAGVEFVVTGSPVTRYEMLSAMTDGMMNSIFISITISSLFLIVVFRSVKDGIFTIVPVVLVSTWVFGTMWLFGFTINVVTVTIAAMTIGVGVDYSVHIRQRYREELDNGLSRNKAMDMAIEHSGKALLGAAATTALGFGVLYFAEMNLFSMYGLLSALMIVYAFLAAITVLPVLLVEFCELNRTSERGSSLLLVAGDGREKMETDAKKNEKKIVKKDMEKEVKHVQCSGGCK